MTNETQGFQPAPFPQLAGQQPAAAPEPPKKKGGRRGPRPPKPAAGKPKRGKKPPRKAATPAKPSFERASIAARTGKSRALKVDLATAMTALSGLTPDDAKVVHSFVQALQPFGRKQRERILLALGKVMA